MKTKSRIIGALGAVVLAATAAVSLAVPAQAADYNGYCNNGSTNVNLSFNKTVGDTYTFQDGSVTGIGCTLSTTGTAGVFTWTSSNGADTPSTDPTSLSQGATLTITMATAGTETIIIGGATRTYTFAFTVTGGGGGGGGGGGSSSSSSAAAPTQTLSLAVSASGATCTGGNPSGVSGSWLTLPSADQCTQSGPTAKAGAVLLGWSTSASFPIARAQAQVDKKWGAIDETIDGIRMIFIPAGMPTFVSGSNNLYPIWSK